MARHHDRASGSLAPESASPARPEHPAFEGDVLSDVLRGVRLTGALFFLNDVAPPWSAEAPVAAALRPVVLPDAQHLVSYHVVTQGACWCEVEGRPALRLEAGDVVVLPHGDAYALSTEPGALGTTPPEVALEWFGHMVAGDLPLVVREGGTGGARTHVFCGFLGCDLLPFNPVLAALPRVLHVRPPGGDSGRLARLVDLAMAETHARLPGRGEVLLRLSELLFVEVIRSHLAASGASAAGWLAGLADPFVGRALTRIHRDPAHAWTVEDLAHASGLSRSALAERFTRLVGQPPMQYVARWRMQVAAGLLAGGAAKIGAVAREVGYESEAAFSRAFKQLAGTSPSHWRQRRRAG